MGCGAFQSSMPEGEACLVPFGCLSPSSSARTEHQLSACRTGTYFCSDKSVTAVVIKVRRQQLSLPSAVLLAAQWSLSLSCFGVAMSPQVWQHLPSVWYASCAPFGSKVDLGSRGQQPEGLSQGLGFHCRVWQSTRMSWALPCAPVDTTTTSLQRPSRGSGTAPACP